MLDLDTLSLAIYTLNFNTNSTSCLLNKSLTIFHKSYKPVSSLWRNHHRIDKFQLYINSQQQHFPSDLICSTANWSVRLSISTLVSCFLSGSYRRNQE